MLYSSRKHWSPDQDHLSSSNIRALNTRYLGTNSKSFIFLLQLFYKLFTDREKREKWESAATLVTIPRDRAQIYCISIAESQLDDVHSVPKKCNVLTFSAKKECAVSI